MFPPVFILRPGGPTSRHGEQIRPPLPRELMKAMMKTMAMSVMPE